MWLSRQIFPSCLLQLIVLLKKYLLNTKCCLGHSWSFLWGDYFQFYEKLLFLPCLFSLLNVGKMIHVLADMLDNKLILKSQSPSDGWCKITERKESTVSLPSAQGCLFLVLPCVKILKFLNYHKFWFSFI